MARRLADAARGAVDIALGGALLRQVTTNADASVVEHRSATSRLTLLTGVVKQSLPRASDRVLEANYEGGDTRCCVREPMAVPVAGS